MKKQVVYFLAVTLVVMAGCQKELSFEQSKNPAEGSLLSEVSGDCLPKTVNGTYEAGTALVASHTITVDVDVTKTGSYIVTTDTVNGIYFRGSGLFTATGSNTITLRGNGTPFAAGTFNFVVSFNGTICDIQVTILPSGAGGPAAFTFESTGTPASCSGASAAGNYIIGTALNSSNTVTLSVNVTTIGTYSISTTATNGMTFSGSGAFVTTGVQPVVLTGSGTPTGTAGAVMIPVTAGSSTCSFQVTTVAGATFAFDCSSAVVNGTYEAGTALNASNTVNINVNVLTAGPYNISTTATNGMVFSASGNFAATGTQPLVLTASGNPTATGTFNIQMPGTPTCSFQVTCTAPATPDWKFTTTIGGTPTTYQGTTLAAILTSVLPPFLNLAYTGIDVPTNTVGFNIIDASGTINNGETYSTVISAGNSAVFTFAYAGGTDQLANDATRNMTFTVVTHNPTTKTITGTFTGQAKNNANATVSISNGTFTAVYQ